MISSLVKKLHSSTLLVVEKLIHMHCCAHILMIMKDGLDVIEEAVRNIRDSVTYWPGTRKG